MGKHYLTNCMISHFLIPSFIQLSLLPTYEMPRQAEPVFFAVLVALTIFHLLPSDGVRFCFISVEAVIFQESSFLTYQIPLIQLPSRRRWLELAYIYWTNFNCCQVSAEMALLLASCVLVDIFVFVLAD